MPEKIPLYPSSPVPETLGGLDQFDLSPEMRAVAVEGIALRLELSRNDTLIALDSVEHATERLARERDELAVQTAQQATMIDKLTHKSERDGKTGLLNAESFKEKILAVTSDDRRKRFENAHNYLFFIDLDDFKSWNTLFTETINDTMTLIPAANAVAAQSRENIDYACRWGGEEFGLFLQNITLEDALAFGGRLRHRINGIVTPETPNGIDQLGVSMGFARLDPGDDYDSVFALANLGKKYVKHLIPGKNQIKNANELTDADIKYLKTLE